MIGCNGGTIGHKVGTKLPRAGSKQAFRQAVALQKFTFESIEMLKEDLKQAVDIELRVKIASAMSNLTKSWDMAIDRKRILKGTPSPGSLRPDSKPKRKVQVHSFPTESAE